MKITQTTNHSQYDLNKYSGVPWKQHFYENQTLSSGKLQALLLSLKVQKTQDDSWFYCKQVQEMHQRTLPEAVVYKVMLTRGKYCQDIVIKKREFILQPSPKKKLN